jgi:hypothetical protein
MHICAKVFLCQSLALAVAGAAASPAHAAAGVVEPMARLADGAPFYASVRPLALLGALKRLGVDKFPELRDVKKQLGVDPLDAKLLEPSGLDVAAPAAGAFFEAAPAGRYHHRVVATLKDPLLFTTFVTAVAASGQAPIQLVDGASPLGKLGVRATTRLPDGSALIARVDGDTLVLDALGALSSHAKEVAFLEVARAYPLRVRGAVFHAGSGARKLFAPDAALVLYADGRKLGPFLAAADNPAPNGKKTAPSPCVKQWATAASTFDDAALALAVDHDGVEAQLAWGAPGPVPLHFRTIDDGALDVESLAGRAPLTAALYAASMQPFLAVKRAGPQTSFDVLSRSIDRCGGPAWGHVLVRSWPQVLGALFGEAQATGKRGGDPMLGTALNAMGQLRNVAVALRDSTDARMPHGALTATFDAAARPVFDLFLASAPGGGKTTPLGKRTPSVFHLTEDLGNLVAALETLASGSTALTLSESDDSLGWAFKAQPSQPSGPRAGGALPLFVAHVDPAAIKRMPAMATADADFVRVIDALVPLKRLDGRIVTDGDLFRVTVRAAAK